MRAVVGVFLLAAAVAQDYVIRGRAVNSNGQAIASVEAELWARRAIGLNVLDEALLQDAALVGKTESGSDGRFAFSVLHDVPYELRVRDRSGLEADVPAYVGGKELQVQLQKMCGIDISVADEAGKPVAGASIYVIRSLRPCGRRYVANQLGRKRIEGLAPGAYILFVEGNGLQPVMEKVLVGGASQAVCAIRMKRGHAIAGSMVASDGRPIEGALIRPPLTFLGPFVSGADGGFCVIGGGGDFSRVFLAQARGYSPTSLKPVSRSPGNVDVGQVVMEQGIHIRGRVLDCLGRPLSLRQVYIVGADPNVHEIALVRAVSTDVNGWYEVGDVNRNWRSWIVVTYMASHVVREVPLGASANSVLTVPEITIPRVAMVDLRLRYGGDVSDDIVVELWGYSHARDDWLGVAAEQVPIGAMGLLDVSRWMMDGNGRVRLPRPEPGSYRLIVRRADDATLADEELRLGDLDSLDIVLTDR